MKRSSHLTFIMLFMCLARLQMTARDAYLWYTAKRFPSLPDLSTSPLEAHKNSEITHPKSSTQNKLLQLCSKSDCFFWHRQCFGCLNTSSNLVKSTHHLVCSCLHQIIYMTASQRRMERTAHSHRRGRRKNAEQ